MTHSTVCRKSAAAGYDGTPQTRAVKNSGGRAPQPAGAKTRRGRDKVEAEIEKITRKPWTRRVITWQLDGDQPRDLRLSWSVDPEARAALEEEIFGKHALITSHYDWPPPDVIAGYPSHSEAEISFR